jgi:hypothetical protein
MDHEEEQARRPVGLGESIWMDGRPHLIIIVLVLVPLQFYMFLELYHITYCNTQITILHFFEIYHGVRPGRP